MFGHIYFKTLIQYVKKDYLKHGGKAKTQGAYPFNVI